MVDLASDPATGDVLLQNNDFQFVRDVDYIRQSLSIRLRFFLNEWFFPGPRPDRPA